MVKALVAVAVTVIEPPKLTADPLIVTDELVSLALAIDPANMVLVTVPVSPDVISVPAVAGIVMAVVPATAAGVIVIVPDVAPGRAMLRIPVSAWLADERFSVKAVVPIYAVELPRTDDGIVPESWPAGRLVSEAPEPENVVAARTPVDGINVSFELETWTLSLPDVLCIHAG